MNKRIKNKINKRNNTNRNEIILSKILQYFTLNKKRYMNRYFIFSMGENSVCHFSLEETPNWKYGIWLNEKGFQIFGEHDWLIDKFKPSRTYISFENEVQGFIQKVKNISKNLKMYFVDSLTDGSAVVDYVKETYGDAEDDFYYNGYQAIREYNEETKLYNQFRRDESITQEGYIESKWNEYIEEQNKLEQDHEFDRAFAFSFFKSLLDIYPTIKAVGIHDRNKKGWCSNPRYDIKVVVEEYVSQNELYDLYNSLDNLIHEQNYSECRKSHKHTFSFMGCYDSLKDIKKCNYKYKK